MASKYWIKLYHEILDDPKMGLMPDRLWRRAVELFLMAGEFDNDGWLPSIPEMAYRLRLSEDELIDDINFLIFHNIVSEIEGRHLVTKFGERQEKMLPAEFMRRQRERKRKEEYRTLQYGDHKRKINPETDQENTGVTDGVTDPLVKRYKSVSGANAGANADKIRLDKIRLDKIEITAPNPSTDEKTDITDELDNQFQEVWLQSTGKPITSPYNWYQMLVEFTRAGVTPELYAIAIKEQTNSKYPVTGPTSVKNWALGLVRDKNHSRSGQSQKRTRRRVYYGPDGEEIIEEVEV